MSTMYQQPVLPISDPQTFDAVKGAIEASFSSGHVAEFLKSLERSKLRIRSASSTFRPPDRAAMAAKFRADHSDRRGSNWTSR